MASKSEAGGSYCIGIEEEYFLAHLDSLEAPKQTPQDLFDELEGKTKDQAGRESLQAQVEVCTAPSTSISEVRDELCSLRRDARNAALKRGLTTLASGTHPLARWREVEPSRSERYVKVMDSLRMIGRRNMLCGMHVHVELPDPRRRVDLMTRFIPYIPLFVALSASSPYWQSAETGLMSYRLAAYDELPRSGIPELFVSEEDYNRYTSALIEAGAIQDASFVWWMIRPSLKYPTLELRAPDVCTRLGDAIALACLYRVLAHHLFRVPEKNAGLAAASRGIAVENKWIAQRYGIHGRFAGGEGARSVGEFLDEVLDMTAEDARTLDCEQEVAHCRVIIANGTSADRQLEIARERKHEGSFAALRAVAQWIAEETLAC